MTFGVKHLISRKKQVNGWYYLLPEEIGRRKHLQVAPRRPLVKDRGKHLLIFTNMKKYHHRSLGPAISN